MEDIVESAIAIVGGKVFSGVGGSVLPKVIVAAVINSAIVFIRFVKKILL